MLNKLLFNTTRNNTRLELKTLISPFAIILLNYGCKGDFSRDIKIKYVFNSDLHEQVNLKDKSEEADAIKLLKDMLNYRDNNISPGGWHCDKRNN